MSPGTISLIFVALLVVGSLGLVAGLLVRFQLRTAASRARIAALEELLAAAAADDASASIRADIVRRIADERASAPRLLPDRLDGLGGRLTGPRPMIAAAVVLCAVIAVSATMMVVQTKGPPTEGARAEAPVTPSTGHPGGGDVQQMIGELEQKLKAQPDDAPGWGMLGWSYFQTARYEQAARAYERAARLDPKTGEYLSALGESIVRASGGQVSAEAQSAFRRALAVDTGDPRARYFLAVLKDQSGDHAGAMHDWIELIRTAPDGAPWAAEIRAFVVKIARSRGEDISAQLPPPSPGAAPADTPAPGPTGDQVAAASQMSDADRQVMIAGMVDRLAERLRTQPNDPDGWMRLIRARMVQGRPDEAGRAYRSAMAALAGDPAHQAELKRLAQQLGVSGI